MHHVDTNAAYGEKVWRQLHKNAASCIKQILEATPHKIAAIRPPTTNHEKLDEPDMQGTAGEVWANSYAIYSYRPLHTDEQRQDDQLEHINSSSVPIQDVS